MRIPRRKGGARPLTVRVPSRRAKVAAIFTLAMSLEVSMAPVAGWPSATMSRSRGDVGQRPPSLQCGASAEGGALAGARAGCADCRARGGKRAATTVHECESHECVRKKQEVATEKKKSNR